MKIAIALVVVVIAVAALVVSLQYMQTHHERELPPVTGQAVNSEEEALTLLEMELEKSLEGITDQDLENLLLDQ